MNFNFTIKKFKKGLKLLASDSIINNDFTIKKFKKGLKQCYSIARRGNGVSEILP
ncbi:hypothetical protein H4853_000630 [Campylobacter jejuni]|nr:hypothetical protein [Campylobacter jejuni]EGA3460453.1 hypothetical protein [Campylobacter jejuni]